MSIVSIRIAFTTARTVFSGLITLATIATSQECREAVT